MRPLFRSRFRALGLIVSATGVALAAAARVATAGEYCVECSGPAAVYRCAGEGGVPDRDPKLQLICASEMSRQGGHESCSVRRQSSAVCDGPLRTVAAPALPVATREGTASGPPPTGVPPSGLGDARRAGEAQGPADGTADAAAPRGAGPADAMQEPRPTTPVTTEPGPPRTVEEAAEGLVKSSSKGLKAAGNAVSDTTEKTANAVGGTAKSAGNMVMDGARTAGQAVGKAGSAVGDAAKKSWHCVASLFSDC